MADSAQKLEENTTIRSLDPNVLQRHASTPEESVWVGASAGSGKTKVLTDRILRLLLPQKNSEGVDPQKILALTFTKAAASEMALRISKRLSEWATLPLEGQKGLEENLSKLLGTPPTKNQLDKARQLFADVVDTPGGLKIMTIHSFCQSVLGRFPLEADLPPNFKALEESQSRSLLMLAIQENLNRAEEEKGSDLSLAVNEILSIHNEDQLTEILEKFISERRQAENIIRKYFNPEGLYNNLCQFFEINPAKNKEEYEIENLSLDPNIEENLRNACAKMASGSPKTDQKNSFIILDFLDVPKEKRQSKFSDYKSVFLTQKNTIQSRIVTKAIFESDPTILNTLHAEANRLIKLQEDVKKLYISSFTRDLFIIGQAVLESYNRLKLEDNTLDFDDLILKTLDLLQGKTNNLNGLNATPWIRYKMDQGIDHILVDESQDTNPEQWEIIKILCDDFFHNIEDQYKTVFLVGDEKQSIFSFQRASPEKFHEIQKWFDTKIKNIKKNLNIIDFETSFRSTPAILDFVDHVFEKEEQRKGLSFLPIKHYSFRKKQAGHVELWPIFENDTDDNFDPWALPFKTEDISSGASKMANHIGETIKNWINNKKSLPSHDRPIEPGDIMILVKSRNAFLDQLVRALKTKDIPVSGVDRMVLKDQLVIQDLIALMKFALLPDDELNLATILKSPLIGWNEEKLYKYCYKRQSSLWSNIKQNITDDPTVNWLKHLIIMGSKATPYDFISDILQKPCPNDEMSGLRAIKSRLGEECLDPLNEFINKTLEYEKENSANLQNFVQSHHFDDSQIKRQMDEGQKAVRIMTVHGSKGLQSPIVILPDTVRSSRGNKTERIFWPDKTGHAFPYFCPTSDLLPSACQEAKQTLQEREDQEYRRLLYVALTRAEDMLYIGGYKGKKDMIDESWYKYVSNAFDRIKDVHTKTHNDLSIKIFSNPATDKPDRQTDKADYTGENIEIPKWLHQPLPEQESAPKIHTPSKSLELEEEILSPLSAIQDYRFKRGNITHKLLQILPDVKANDRQKRAEHYVAQPAYELPQNVQREIVSEVMQILNDTQFAPIFGEGSVAEAPITGYLDDNRLISGQIDRLLITDTQIYIIDYKSNRPSPQSAKDVPVIYESQMRTYADIMRKIYPNHVIKAALLWTDNCHLMEIDVS